MGSLDADDFCFRGYYGNDDLPFKEVDYEMMENWTGKSAEELKADHKRLIILMTIVEFFVVFSMLDVGTYVAGMVYTGIYVICLAFFTFSDKLGEFFILGIDKRIGQNILLGLVIGVAFIVLNNISESTFTIGLPFLPYALGDLSKGIIINAAAPVNESALVPGIVMGFLISVISAYYYSKGALTKGQMFMIICVGIMMQLATFVLYHGIVYGSFEIASAAYIGAGVFALATGITTFIRKDLLHTIVAHAVLNTYLFTTLTMTVIL